MAKSWFGYSDVSKIIKASQKSIIKYNNESSDSTCSSVSDKSHKTQVNVHK